VNFLTLSELLPVDLVRPVNLRIRTELLTAKIAVLESTRTSVAKLSASFVRLASFVRHRTVFNASLVWLERTVKKVALM
jgi:hypothetical protein